MGGTVLQWFAVENVLAQDFGSYFARGGAGVNHETGPGDDLLDGGTGKDTLEGEDGDDELLGRIGNDTLDGGAGLDLLDGSAGTDTCLNGETLIDCE